MSSLSDEDDSFNSNPDRYCDGQALAEPTTTMMPGDPARPPPTARQFARSTTRYMIEAREYVRADPERALDALRRAVVPWDGFFHITLWVWRGFNPKGGTAVKPGDGVEHRTTIDRYATMLADNAKVVRPKGQLACVTLGRSRYHGSFDDECTMRTGIFLDSDDNGGWDRVRALSRTVGLSFAAQMRPPKPHSHHFEAPVAKPWVPARDADGAVRDWKMNIYRPQLGWIQGLFSELAELRYDLGWDEGGQPTATRAGYDTATDRLLQLNFIYHLRPNDPRDLVPITDFSVGGALDVETLLASTGYQEARVRLERPSQADERSTPPRFDLAKKQIDSKRRTNVPGLEEIDTQEATSTSACVSNVALQVRLRRLTNPESQKLINLVLEGRSYAPLGERNSAMWRIVSILAYLAPNANPSQIAEVFRKSLETMAKQPGAEPAVGYVEFMLAHATKMLARAQRRAGGAA